MNSFTFSPLFIYLFYIHHAQFHLCHRPLFSSSSSSSSSSLLSQAFPPCYFSWTNGDPHLSGFKFQTAALSVLCIMFPVRIAVFCSESTECFLGMAPKFFFKLFVTIPVAPMITWIIIHFMFHVHCISIHKLLYFSPFLLPFVWHFSVLVLVRMLFSHFGF